METVLDTGHTWFLEACTQLPSGELRILLAEGIKEKDRLPVQINDTTLGPHFPVVVKTGSRLVEVRFPQVLALFTFNESYDVGALQLATENRSVLRQVSDSSFRRHVATNTAAFDLSQKPVAEWFLWTEDQIFQVIASGAPQVVECPEGPDLSLDRSETWSAN